VLASIGGMTLVVAHLYATGALCSECGYGTRVTSKRWARCKRCGARVRRRTKDEADAVVDEALAAARTPTPSTTEDDDG
jgi:tRNA(Ile2) C34 agmatinyltransferase TiaS